MGRYKIEYEFEGKENYAVVEAEGVADARETFLIDYADIDPEIDGISPYTVYDEIQAERMRQIKEEGYSLEHDDKLTHGELAAAAAAYTFPGMLEKMLWPFKNPIKKKDTRSNLIHAAALIVAEIERLDRLNRE
jgi:hypothetical protein